MDNHQIAYLDTVPFKVRGTIKKAFEGTTSPRQAIKAKCLACSSYQRPEISFCRAVTCPLWAFRPYTQSEERNAA